MLLQKVSLKFNRRAFSPMIWLAISAPQIVAVSKKPDPGPRTSLRLANLTGPWTSLRLDNWSADQFAFGQLVRGPVCVWTTGPRTSLRLVNWSADQFAFG